MADPLSIAASIAGLLTLGAQVLGLIGNIKTKGSSELTALNSEISSLRNTLSQLQVIVQDQQTDTSKDKDWLGALNGALCECGDTLLGLQKLCSTLVATGRREALWKRMKWTLKGSEVADLCRRLESYKSTLNLLLSTRTTATTSNIQDILKQVHNKLLSTPQLAPVTRPPVSWRQKLSGFSSTATTSSTSVEPKLILPNGSQESLNSFKGPPWVVPCEETKDWGKPGVYGIQQDEGNVGPDLEDPNIVSVLEMPVGKHEVKLLCTFEQVTEFVRSTTAHLVIRQETAEDVFFLEIGGIIMNERFVCPVGDCSLILACPRKDEDVATADSLGSLQNSNNFYLQMEGYLFNCQNNKAILLNFERDKERESFLRGFYALRYLPRAWSLMNQTDSRLNPEWAVIPDLQTKPVLLQIEYGSGKEKSYASPVLGFLDNAKDGPPIMVAKLQLMQPQTRYLFQEYVTQMEVHIDAQVVTVTPKDSDIQKITLTFTSIRVRFYFSLKDLAEEWRAIGEESLVLTRLGEWQIPQIKFRPLVKQTLGPEFTIKNCKTVLSVSRFWHRIRLDISGVTYNDDGIEEEKVCVVYVRAIGPVIMSLPNSGLCVHAYFDLSPSTCPKAYTDMNGMLDFSVPDAHPMKKILDGLQDQLHERWIPATKEFLVI